MAFLRGTWRFLVGFKDALVLLLLLLFFVGLWGALHSRGPLTVPGGAALVLDLDGPIVDQPSEQSTLALASGNNTAPHQIAVRDIIRAVDRARDDSRIKLIVLDLDAFIGAGQANLQSVAGSLQAFRKAGKPVYAYATAYTDASYYLAAQANSVAINPLGGVLLTGPGGPNVYLKKALDKLDIDVNVFRVGTYKSAVEPFLRNDASPEAKAAEQALVDSLWSSYAADVRAVRPTADVNAVLANFPARIKAANGDLATVAVQSHLVDKISTSVDFGRGISKLVGRGSDKREGSYNSVPLGRYLAATDRRESGPAVGVVYVAGTIVDGEARPGTAGGDTISGLIAKALTNPDIKALVVRIDSPGGSVLASERIREALVVAKQKGLPIVASFGPVAASGGYWVSTAADAVYAQPSTITGSIGVFAVIPTFNRALTALGIGTDGVKSTPYSGDPDILRGLTPDTKVILQASVEDIYRRFTGLVAKARHLPLTRVDEIGQGRVWSGRSALGLKLVDGLGGLDVAVAEARRRANLAVDARTIDIERQPSVFVKLLASVLESPNSDDTDAQATRDPFGQAARLGQTRLMSAIGEASAVASGPTIQAHCLSCSGLVPPRPDYVARAQGLLAKAMALAAR
jgi:protease-4